MTLLHTLVPVEHTPAAHWLKMMMRSDINLREAKKLCVIQKQIFRAIFSHKGLENHMVSPCHCRKPNFDSLNAFKKKLRRSITVGPQKLRSHFIQV